MRLDKFTTKLQQALQDSIDFATASWQQQIEPEDLFYTLLRQEDSIVADVFAKIGIQIPSILKLLEEALSKKPRISGKNVQVYFSSRFNSLLNNATKEAKALKDEFISGEHILPALFSDEDSLVTKELKEPAFI